MNAAVVEQEVQRIAREWAFVRQIETVYKNHGADILPQRRRSTISRPKGNARSRLINSSRKRRRCSRRGASCKRSVGVLGSGFAAQNPNMRQAEQTSPLIAYVWVPYFETNVARRAGPSLGPGPLVLLDEHGRVLAGDAPALQAGILPGLTERQAAARCPEAMLLPASRFPLWEAQEQFLDCLKPCTDRWQPAGPGRAYLQAPFTAGPAEPTGIPPELVRWCQAAAAAVRRFSPATFSLMEFKNRREMEIAARIYANHPLLGEEVPDAWNVRFTREFDMTNDSHLFRDREWLEAQGCREVYLTGEPVLPSPASGKGAAGEGRRPTMWLGPDGERYLPLYEGKMVHQFDHAFEAPRFWVAESEGSQAMAKGAQEWDWRVYRGGFRDVAANTNERSLIAAIVPPTFRGNKLPTIGPTSLPSWLHLYLVSVFNSFAVDFLIRMKVTMTLNFHYLFGLPVPRLDLNHPHFDALVPRAARLTCTAPEFADLWDEVAQQYPQAMPAPWRPEVAATDPRERAQLRAEIDALVADLYGLGEEDFAYILSTFPLLDRDQPALPGEPKSFITRDQALLDVKSRS